MWHQWHSRVTPVTLPCDTSDTPPPLISRCSECQKHMILGCDFESVESMWERCWKTAGDTGRFPFWKYTLQEFREMRETASRTEVAKHDFRILIWLSFKFQEIGQRLRNSSRNYKQFFGNREWLFRNQETALWKTVNSSFKKQYCRLFALSACITRFKSSTVNYTSDMRKCVVESVRRKIKDTGDWD